MKQCIKCEKTDRQVPLLHITFAGEEKYICPQCLPVLIHKPQQLTDKLPGMEISAPAEH